MFRGEERMPGFGRRILETDKKKPSSVARDKWRNSSINGDLDLHSPCGTRKALCQLSVVVHTCNPSSRTRQEILKSGSRGL